MTSSVQTGNLHSLPARWQISWHLSGEEGELLHICHSGVPALTAVRQGELLEAAAYFAGREAPCRLAAEVRDGDEILLRFEGPRIALFAGGRLQDEDWPLGEVPLEGGVCLRAPADAVIAPADEDAAESPAVLGTIHRVQGWKPAGRNTHVGDCMPYSHDGVFHLFYLFDRRGHASKWGMGAHQWAHISSVDLREWQEHPLALRIDRQEEASICTGSVIAHNGLYWAFYAVRSADNSPARLTWATSKDGIRFEKSGEQFVLSAPYEPVSARDPKVYRGDDGLFHMLVTTSRVDGESPRGCLAHCVSRDLSGWEQREPMVTLAIEDQPECSDYFAFGGFYYLVYSNYGVAHYFVSRSPNGPWQAPGEDNVVVSPVLRVPKAAVWRGRLIFAGFVIDQGVNWGGTVRFYEAHPQADGRLLFDKVPEMEGGQ